MYKLTAVWKLQRRIFCWLQFPPWRGVPRAGHWSRN